MKTDDNGTSIWIDKETKKTLAELARKNGRTVIGQIRLMLEKELALDQPVEDSRKSAQN